MGLHSEAMTENDKKKSLVDGRFRQGGLDYYSYGIVCFKRRFCMNNGKTTARTRGRRGRVMT